MRSAELSATFLYYFSNNFPVLKVAIINHMKWRSPAYTRIQKEYTTTNWPASVIYNAFQVPEDLNSNTTAADIFFCIYRVQLLKTRIRTRFRQNNKLSLIDDDTKPVVCRYPKLH